MFIRTTLMNHVPGWKSIYRVLTFYFLNLCFFSFPSFSQGDTIQPDSALIKFSGYTEVYYSYDFSNPENNQKPSFLYSHNRHNEFTINLAFLKASYNRNNIRSSIAFMTGSYSNANLAAEPGVFKNIFESMIGVRLSRRNNLWLDAGVFSSHIGFESAHSPSCWSLTRSMLAENSPYYESGVKVTFINKKETWLFSVLALNGWQRIQRLPGNSAPSFGTQVTYTPTPKITLNSSTFIGSDYPDSLRRMRYFHNFYSIFSLSKKINITAGFDIGTEQDSVKSKTYNTWFSPVLLIQYQLKEKFSVTGRAEYYSDPGQVIILTGTPSGFQTAGYSINFDYSILENAHARLEGRMFSSKDKIFYLNDQPSTNSYQVTASIALSF